MRSLAQLPSGILSLTLAFGPLVGGCALTPDPQPAQSRGTDSIGDGLRGIPEDSANVSSQQAKKQPFWEKYRDKRVRQIDENLGVEEPAGW